MNFQDFTGFSTACSITYVLNFPPQWVFSELNNNQCVRNDKNIIEFVFLNSVIYGYFSHASLVAKNRAIVNDL